VIAGVLAAVIGAPQVVAIPDDGPAWAELRIALPGGASADPKGKSGLAHVASLVLEQRLSGARVYLGRRGTAIAFGAPSGEIEGIAIEAIDALAKKPKKREVEAAVRLATERRRRFADDDRDLAEMELVRALGAGEHPLGAPDELASITRDDVAAHQRRWWGGDRMLVVISGRCESGVEERIRERLKKLGRAKVMGPEARDTPGLQGGLRVLLIDKPDRRKAHVAIGRLLGKNDAAMIAANAGLGGSMSGRLTRALMRTPYAGPFAFSSIEEDRFVIWSAVKPELSAAAIKRILETLREVAKEGLAPEEIALGKRIAASGIELSQRDAAARADAAVRAHLSAVEVNSADLLGATDDAVRRTSRALARSDGLAIVVVASASAELQAELLAIPGVKEVQVVRYDLR
jgi:predicted Zn-dependent peptidase